MTTALPKGHTRGTHRLVAPETTLARIAPHLAEFGITRCADITGLDSIGIHVYVAVRPQGRILQTSNGKGLTHVDAKVSACMEAIEHWHAENPTGPFRRSCVAELTAERDRILTIEEAADRRDLPYVGDRRKIDWVRGKELFSEEPTWVPSFAAYFRRHVPFRFSFNGLASGNHPIEAVLHALYEVVERDTLAALSEKGNVRLSRCQVIDCGTIIDEAVGSLCEQVRRAGVRLLLLRAPSSSLVHTFLAVFLDASSSFGASAVNFGTGSHLSQSVAAIRAITEAAQSRLTYIHGSREDLHEQAYARGPTHEVLFAYFSKLTPDTAWGSLEDSSAEDLLRDYHIVLESVRGLGYGSIYAVELSQGKAGVSVMKALIPGTRWPSWI